MAGVSAVGQVATLSARDQPRVSLASRQPCAHATMRLACVSEVSVGRIIISLAVKKSRIVTVGVGHGTTENGHAVI